MNQQQPAAPVPRRSLCAALVTTAVVGGWLTALVVPPLLLLRWRRGWLEQFDRPEHQLDWEEFRRDMERQSGRAGPVQRKVPKSPEPPARVWLRDHAPLAVAAWILFVGVLGGFFSLLVAGVLRGSGELGSLAQDEPRRQRDHHEEDQSDAENTEQ